MITSRPRTGRPLRHAAVVAMVAVSLAAAPGSAFAAGGAGGEPRAPRTPGFEALAQLGEWVRLANGERAWRPEESAADWQPYRVGHWAWTSDGWFWVSAEPWAWATYHHGRWRFDGRFGWVWLPGTVWHPSVVVWRYGPGVVGWAPRTDDGRVLPCHWTFLPASRFAGVPVATAAIAAPRVPRLLAASRVVAASPGPLPSGRDPAAVATPAALRSDGPDRRGPGGALVSN